MVFMGEEWGASTPWQFFTDFDEPTLADAVRDGRREEFAAHGWDTELVPDPQDAATREASVLDWTELAEPGQARLLAWYRSLITLRRVTPDLRSDDLTRVRASYDEAAWWFVLERGRYRVVVNLATAQQVVPVGGENWHVVLAWDGCEVAGGAATLSGQSVAILGPAS